MQSPTPSVYYSTARDVMSKIRKFILFDCLLSSLVLMASYSLISFLPFIFYSRSSDSNQFMNLDDTGLFAAATSSDYQMWLLISIFATIPMLLNIVLDWSKAKSAIERNEWFSQLMLGMSLIAPNIIIYCFSKQKSTFLPTIQVALFSSQQITILGSLFCSMFGHKLVNVTNVNEKLSISVGERTIYVLFTFFIGKLLSFISYLRFGELHKGLMIASIVCSCVALAQILYMLYRMLRFLGKQTVKWKFKCHNQMSDFWHLLAILYFILSYLGISVYTGRFMHLDPQADSVPQLVAYLCVQIVLTYLLTIIPGRSSLLLAEIKQQKLETRLNLIRYVSHEMRAPLNTASQGLMLVTSGLVKIKKSMIACSAPKGGTRKRSERPESPYSTAHSGNEDERSNTNSVYLSDGATTERKDHSGSTANDGASAANQAKKNSLGNVGFVPEMVSPLSELQTNRFPLASHDDKEHDIASPPNAASTSSTSMGEQAPAKVVKPPPVVSHTQHHHKLRPVSSGGISTHSIDTDHSAGDTVNSITPPMSTATITPPPSTQNLLEGLMDIGDVIEQIRQSKAVNSKEMANALRALTDSSQVDDILETTRYINDSYSVAMATLDDLLTFDKLDEGKLVIELDELNPWKFVCDVAKPFEINAKLADIRFSVTCVDVETQWTDGLCVKADKFKMSQVVRNIISNALKFTPAGGHVQVVINKVPVPTSDSYNTRMTKKELLRITVSDTGAGISKENQARLFGQYVQFNPGQLQQGKGSGLGLWITKNIVDLHSGKIRAMSKGEGQGTTFHVELPLYKREVVQQQQQKKKKKTRKMLSRGASPRRNRSEAKYMLTATSQSVEAAEDNMVRSFSDHSGGAFADGVVVNDLTLGSHTEEEHANDPAKSIGLSLEEFAEVQKQLKVWEFPADNRTISNRIRSSIMRSSVHSSASEDTASPVKSVRSPKTSLHFLNNPVLFWERKQLLMESAAHEVASTLRQAQSDDDEDSDYGEGVRGTISFHDNRNFDNGELARALEQQGIDYVLSSSKKSKSGAAAIAGEVKGSHSSDADLNMPVHHNTNIPIYKPNGEYNDIEASMRSGSSCNSKADPKGTVSTPVKTAAMLAVQVEHGSKPSFDFDEKPHLILPAKDPHFETPSKDSLVVSRDADQLDRMEEGYYELPLAASPFAEASMARNAIPRPSKTGMLPLDSVKEGSPGAELTGRSELTNPQNSAAASHTNSNAGSRRNSRAGSLPPGSIAGYESDREHPRIDTSFEEPSLLLQLDSAALKRISPQAQKPHGSPFDIGAGSAGRPPLEETSPSRILLRQHQHILMSEPPVYQRQRSVSENAGSPKGDEFEAKVKRNSFGSPVRNDFDPDSPLVAEAKLKKTSPAFTNRKQSFKVLPYDPLDAEQGTIFTDGQFIRTNSDLQPDSSTSDKIPLPSEMAAAADSEEMKRQKSRSDSTQCSGGAQQSSTYEGDDLEVGAQGSKFSSPRHSDPRAAALATKNAWGGGIFKSGGSSGSEPMEAGSPHHVRSGSGTISGALSSIRNYFAGANASGKYDMDQPASSHHVSSSSSNHTSPKSNTPHSAMLQSATVAEEGIANYQNYRDRSEEENISALPSNSAKTAQRVVSTRTSNLITPTQSFDISQFHPFGGGAESIVSLEFLKDSSISGSNSTIAADGDKKGEPKPMVVPAPIEISSPFRTPNSSIHVPVEHQASTTPQYNDSPQRRARARTHSSDKTWSRGLRFLVVDDTMTNRKMTAKVLKNHGHTVDEASDGVQFLAKIGVPYDPSKPVPTGNLKMSGSYSAPAAAASAGGASIMSPDIRNSASYDTFATPPDGLSLACRSTDSRQTNDSVGHFDVVLMDDSMPQLTGPQATAIAREHGYTGLIFGVTGNVYQDSIDHFTAMGANAVFGKPLNVDDLKKSIRQTL